LASVQAHRLTDFFSETLLQILQKKGYKPPERAVKIPPAER
jgi:hypothetical protein